MPILKKIIIVGGGPAGLMAAQVLAEAGCRVSVYDRMPSVGRKFLMAGRGGLNLTHSENIKAFLGRYGAAEARLAPAIQAFPPEALRAWSEKLGQPTIVGSSGRVFPSVFKASPLLRAWLRRLETLGVTFYLRRKWIGWNEAGELLFENAEGVRSSVICDAALFALGGASWPRLGSDGSWVEIFKHNDIAVASLRPANCGFCVNWSETFIRKFAGIPIKPVVVTFMGESLRGEAMATKAGIEGGIIYKLSAVIRDAIEQEGQTTLSLDLRPDVSQEDLTQKLSAPRKSQSLSTFLLKAGGLSPIAASLVQEILHQGNCDIETPLKLATFIKTLPLTLTAPFPLARAISTAGGLCFDELDENFMLRKNPGVFVCGEMLDWEAPTGGYLLQAVFSSAVAAAVGMMKWINK